MRARLLELIGDLRAAGMTVSVAETIDALRAVEVAGVGAAVLREALAATLVKHEEDRPCFDAAFDALFAAPPPDAGRRGRKRSARAAGGGGATPGGGARGEGRAAPSATGAPPRRSAAEPAPSEAARSPGREADRRLAEPPRRAAVVPDDPSRPSETRTADAAPSPSAERGEGARRAAALLRASRPSALLTRPFHAMEPAEVGAARDVARELGVRFAARVSRRERRLRRGRIDVRRTMRASLAHGGVPIDPQHRGRRPGKPDLLVLCDVSGSVALASEMLLAILGGAESAFRRVHRFAFVDRAVEVGLVGGHLAPAGPLDLWARSDFGAVLVGLEAAHLAAFDRATVALVLGDARNNRRPPRADVLGRLRARSRALVWAVPEPRSRWYTGDSALAAYEPHCDIVCAATSLAELVAALREARGR